MAFPIALIPASLSALRGLIALRGKVDAVLSASRAGADVPLLLPHVTEDRVRNNDDLDRVVQVFGTDTPERNILLARGLGPDLERFGGLEGATAQPEAEERRILHLRLLKALYEIEDAREGLAARPWLGHPDPRSAGLDYFLVASYQSADRPPAVRVLLTVCETLVEYAGENAALFVSRTATGDLVATLLREFAARSDLETDSAGRLIRLLLGSAAVAATDHAGGLPQHPALGLLLASLGRVRAEMGEDFVLRIATHGGFQAVVVDWLTTAPRDPALTQLVARIARLDETGYDPNDPGTLPPELQPAYGAVAAVLQVIGSELGTARAFDDPEAFRRVFNAALRGLATHSAALVHAQAGGKPALAALLEAALGQVAGSADPVQALASGELAGALYGAALEALAKTPDLDGDGAVALVEALGAALAGELSRPGPAEVLNGLQRSAGPEVPRRLLAQLVELMGRNPENLLGAHRGAVVAVIGAVLEGAGPLIADGLDPEDLVELADTALGRWAAELPSAGLPDAVRATLGAAASAVASSGGLGRLLNADGRREVLAVTVRSVAEHPAVWTQLSERGLAGPLVEGLTAGISRADASRALAPQLAAICGQMLEALVRHALDLADATAATAAEDRFREMAARAARTTLDEMSAALGRGLSGRDLPAVAGPLADRVLRDLAGGDGARAEAESLVRRSLDEMRAARV
jgi:hypothetical protein